MALSVYCFFLVNKVVVQGKKAINYVHVDCIRLNIIRFTGCVQSMETREIQGEPVHAVGRKKFY